MKPFTVLLMLLLSLSLGVSRGWCGTDYVVIDRRVAAFTVFAGIPEGQLETVTARITDAKVVDIVRWEIFRGNSDKYVKAHIVKDEYPGSRAVQGIVEIIRKHPGLSIGLTWNGGLAFTRNDYRFAQSSYELYLSNPADYAQARNADPRQDPVNPEKHLPALLGR